MNLCKAVAVLAVLFSSLNVLAFPNELADRTKRLGVIVLAGHEVELARVGALVFGNKRSLVASPNDVLTVATFEEVKSQLDQEERYEVRHEFLPAESFQALADKAHSGASAFFGPQIDGLEADLARYRASCQCDALLLVAATRGHMDPNSNQTFKGFAWVGFGGVGDAVHRTAAVAYLALFLVDASTGKVAAVARTSTDRGTILHSVPVAFTLWPTEMNSLPEEQWKAVTSAFRDELRSTLRRPLYRLGLKPSCNTHFFEFDNPPNPAGQNQDPFAPTKVPVIPAGSDPKKCK